ncbi:hypothetical protein [Nonomuraea sp. NPDC048916]|uniref:hypothetical protein n=1 Tax=Nonomuraea sp. NPDC048916 TaxID=3154232 RepID=UPI0033F2CDEE
MFVKSVVAALAAMVVAVAGAPAAHPAASEPRVKLAGTSGEVRDTARGPVLASYSLVFDAGQGHYGYLREGGRFVKTRYREALVAPGERWVAGIPDNRLWVPVKTIDLMDRGSGRTYKVRLPAPVTSPEWSSDGRTLLLTAYRPHSDGSLTIIGFVTLNVADRVPRLVRTGPRHRVAFWDIGRAHRFYFAGDAGRVMAMHDEPGVAPGGLRIAVYDLRGERRRFYTGVGALDEWHTVTPFSPSGKLFATFVRGGDDGGRIAVVEASTGRIVRRIGDDIHAIAGWYDDTHLIVQRKRSRGQVVYQRVSLSGGADLDLIKERLIAGPAEYEPHLERVNFVRRG